MTQNLQIDPQRLWDSIMDTARIGATDKGGIRRLTLTDLDRQVRDWFKAQCEALGCTVTVDEVGNMFALRPGRRADVAPIALGSHLDTQPTGGKIRRRARRAERTGSAAHAATISASRPTRRCCWSNWTNEEGSRFAPAMLGSGVFAGVFDRAYADSPRTGRASNSAMRWKRSAIAARPPPAACR